MLTNVQSLINELGTYQVSPEQRSSLAGKGPRMKALALEIKALFPSLSAEDKGLFLAAVARGRFEIEKKTIWPMFLDAVGIEAPAAPAPAPVHAPAATNKVAGEILDMAKGHLVGIKRIDKTLELNLLCMDRQHAQLNVQGDNLTLNNERMNILHEIVLDLKEMVKGLQEQVAELKRPATRRTTSV